MGESWWPPTPGRAVGAAEPSVSHLRRILESVPADLVVEREGAALDRLADLEQWIASAVGCARADTTFVAYASDWRSFATWCAALGLSPLPATPATVAGYLVDLADAAEDRSP